MTQDSSRFRILVVDDQPENIRMLMEVLKTEYAVIPATSGEAALEKAFQEPVPDLILLDIIMKGIDGYEVCRQLKSKPETKDIPVIFITAISEAMDAAKAFEIGAVDYVAKPFNPVTVMARVKTHIKLSNTMKDLQRLAYKVQHLEGLIPICSSCNQIRDDKGFWHKVEKYIEERSGAQFSHGVCPDCMDRLYGDKEWYQKRHKKKEQ